MVLWVRNLLLVTIATHYATQIEFLLENDVVLKHSWRRQRLDNNKQKQSSDIFDFEQTKHTCMRQT